MQGVNTGDSVKIAVISDVHGNLGALQAVLDDVGQRTPDLTVNLGDVLSGPLFPAECADLLIGLKIPTIRGNHERQLLTLPSEQMGESDRYTLSCLHARHLSWIGGFPAAISMPEGVLLVHGTPSSDLSYFLETVEPAGSRMALSREVELRAGDVSESLILCGHSHIPRVFELKDRCLIVNPGSVGMPAYEDCIPLPHKMQSGSPHARYAIVEKRRRTWSVELHTVVYDWESAAKAAEEHGRLDWVKALRTGYA